MTWKPFRHFDWSTIWCGVKGHETYLPDEPELAERLHDPTPSGDAVRCLRCGEWISGEPRRRGPADRAPLVLRGPALRDAVILRLLAVERLLRGWVILAVAYAVWTFKGHQDSIKSTVDSLLPLLSPVAARLHFDLYDTTAMHLITKVLNTGQVTLLIVFGALVFYGLLQMTEATGLWLMHRWGEYVAAVATSLFIPLEIYEITEKPSVLRILTLLINVAAVIYLVVTKRLFGVRGGAAAYEKQRHADSVLEIERAAVGRRHEPEA